MCLYLPYFSPPVLYARDLDRSRHFYCFFFFSFFMLLYRICKCYVFILKHIKKTITLRQTVYESAAIKIDYGRKFIDFVFVGGKGLNLFRIHTQYSCSIDFSMGFLFKLNVNTISNVFTYVLFYDHSPQLGYEVSCCVALCLIVWISLSFCMSIYMCN